MRQNNEALLMKLGWGILTQPNSLWVTVLKTQYIKDGDALTEVSTRRNVSSLWRGICSVWQYVIQGIKWILGDGKIWEDVWIDDEGPLIHKALTVVPMNERAKLVDI